MKTQRFIPHAVLALLLLIVPLMLTATEFGRVKGKVTDAKTGDPVAGVSIRIENTRLGARTDANGEFLIEDVTPGSYALIITSVGYTPVKVTDIVVKADETANLDIRLDQVVLDLGKVTTVTGERKGIDFNQTGTVTIKKPKVVSNAPVPTVDDVLKRETGITHDADGNELHIRGGRAGETTYLVDGVNYGDPLSQSKPTRQKPVEQKPMCPPPPPPPVIPEWEYYFDEEPFDDMFFQNYGTNPFVDTRKDHLSTFAIDVDDASFILTRSYLERGTLPPADAVRVEEFVNHFDYKYDLPEEEAFSVFMEGAPSPFYRNCQLLHIGIKGREIAERYRKTANLVFVIDVSGSMGNGSRLELVKDALMYLVDGLRPDDQVGIVTFNQHGRVLMNMTPVRHRRQIVDAIEQLRPGGSTNAADGLRLGYDMIDDFVDRDETNRIIMCSDGVANTGLTDADEIVKRIKRYADRGITLTTVGVGMGNYNDELLEKLGDKGNGMYAYVDDRAEARRVFVEKLVGTLEVIAADVKIQVDFNPNVVQSYRLLGYENRAVADNKFRDNREDGGEIGAGHEVTAIYEVKLHRGAAGHGLGDVFIRFKDPESRQVRELKYPVSRRVFSGNFASSSSTFKLSVAAAEFAEILRNSSWTRDLTFADVARLIDEVSEERHDNEIAEFDRLVAQASRLQDDRAEYWR